MAPVMVCVNGRIPKAPMVQSRWHAAAQGPSSYNPQWDNSSRITSCLSGLGLSSEIALESGLALFSATCSPRCVNLDRLPHVPVQSSAQAQPRHAAVGVAHEVRPGAVWLPGRVEHEYVVVAVEGQAVLLDG